MQIPFHAYWFSLDKSVFSRKVKKPHYFMAFIISMTFNLLPSSSFWFPDFPHSPFGQFPLQTKLWLNMAYTTVFWSVAKCHWLQLLLCEALPKATDLAVQTDVNPIQSLHHSIKRGNVYWSELTTVCVL